jgi:ubiquinone/menaquinone biosynthesis C-methylase UbiE
MNFEFLKNKSVYLAPKNNITEYISIKFEQEDIVTKGYLDNFKTGIDIKSADEINDDDYIIIYSPNYWKEISKNINTENIYILEIIKDKYNFTNVKNFNSYNHTFKVNHNNLEMQKLLWHKHLKEHINDNKDIEKFGYEWGDPENEFDNLGNYLKINNYLQKLIKSDSIVLEIGTLGGKWTKYMLDAKKIVCVDINNFFIKAIKQRFNNFLNKFEFYISKGNELNGIESNSIDIVFCMDTLVRVEKEYIFEYLKEISRVLKPDAKAIIHLPNSDIKDCVQRGFTTLYTKEIEKELFKNFNSFTMDNETIVHGTIVFAKK